MTEVTPIAPSQLPAGLDLSILEADAGKGGKLDVADISIPFLYVLQGLSPQANAESPRYMKGATAGMVYMTVAEKAFEAKEQGVSFIPCYYERLYTEWVPREQGGGLIAYHHIDTPLMNTAKPDSKGVPVISNGHQMIETAYHYVLVEADPGRWVQAIMPFKSTALKASRKMNGDISTTNIPGKELRAPRWLYKWRFKTERQQKDQNVWSTPLLEKGEIVTREQYDAAKAYAQIAEAGIMRVAVFQAQQAAEQAVRPESKSALDDEVPF